MSDRPRSGLIAQFYYVFGSQVIVLISGFIKALIIPVLLELSDYGYWQIYIFYTVYIGVFTFGYGDGLYLKYGGYKLSDLPLRPLRTANALYLVMLAFGVVAMMIFASGNTDPYRQYVFLAVAINIAVLGITSNVSLTLQATNHLKGYAFLNSADKIFFLLALLALLQDKFRTFEYLVAIDLAAKIIVMAMLLHRYRQLFIGRLARLHEGAREFADSVGTGIQLLLANLSGMLVLGIGRIIIEYFGAMESYAYYAFAVSISGVILVSVTALSIVIYPTLRRQPQDNFIVYFRKTTRAYAAFTLVMLTGYFPAVAFIELVASQYAPVIGLLNAMFVITVLQGKMQLVNNTYYKALRLERSMLFANLNSLLLATTLSLAGFLLTQSILAVAYAALLTMAFRVYASEVFLLRHMGKAPDLGILAEVIVLAAFLLLTLLLPHILAGCAWLTLVAVIATIKRTELSAALRKTQSDEK